MAGLRVLLAACLATVVYGHSWLDCADWRFNDPTAYAIEANRRYENADGYCEGYARRFEVGLKPFGKMDEVQFFRHYVQKFETSPASLACRRNDGTSSSSGSNEGLTAGLARTVPYAPNTNVYSAAWGTWAKVYSGDLLCWRWPAKNHFAHVDIATNEVRINWDDVAGRSAELTQAQMDTKYIGSMLWAKCPVPGPASPGDSTGTGSELRACGGCFTVPTRTPGTYTVQWKWPFKVGETETYTSCADIEVLNPAGVAAVDCVVGAWGAWSVCSSDCGSGTQTRTRAITTPKQGLGAACPTLVSSQTCNTVACINYLSEHVVYTDALVGFADWSWATVKSVTSTAVTAHTGTYSISFVPKSWEAFYLHYSGETGPTIDVKDFQSISFWIHGGSTGGQKIFFSLVSTGASSSSPLFNYEIPVAKIVANVWTKVEIKFADLGFAAGAFDGLWWQANTGATTGISPVYIDDIYFMHVHQGGASPVITDLCADVTCPNAHSKCVAGACVCTDGYSGTACTTAPSISTIVVKDLAGVTATTLTGGASVAISWASTGTIPTVTITLLKTGSSIPSTLASQITNAGTYTWMVPADLVAGTYTVTVLFSTTIKATSGNLVKAEAAVTTGCTGDCNGHGECGEDTSGACVCRFSYNGTNCEIEPSGVIHLSTSLVVGTAFATANSDLVAFKLLFRTEIAAALLVHIDQIEIKSVVSASSGAKTKVTFDLLIGSPPFGASSLALTSADTLTATIDGQLASSDSGINRGTQTYSAPTDVSAAVSLRSVSSFVAGAAMLATLAVIAL